MSERQISQNTVLGALCAFVAVSIWAGWMSVTRAGVLTQLTAADITALRFGVAGLLLLPVIVRHGLKADRLSWWQIAVLIAGAGAPYTLLSATGLRYAPAAHAGALIPCVMPAFVAVLAALFLGERFSVRRLVGYALILCGAISIVGTSALLPNGSQNFGHALFLAASFMWAAIRSYCGAQVWHRFKPPLSCRSDRRFSTCHSISPPMACGYWRLR